MCIRVTYLREKNRKVTGCFCVSVRFYDFQSKKWTDKTYHNPYFGDNSKRSREKDARSFRGRYDSKHFGDIMMLHIKYEDQIIESYYDERYQIFQYKYLPPLSGENWLYSFKLEYTLENGKTGSRTVPAYQGNKEIDIKSRVSQLIDLVEKHGFLLDKASIKFRSLQNRSYRDVMIYNQGIFKKDQIRSRLKP